MSDDTLRQMLKDLRAELVERLGMVETDIYTDETLDDIVKYQPKSLDKLLRIRRIKQANWIYFADDILRVIREKDDRIENSSEPISSLDMDRKDWVIKAKIVSKSDVYQWCNREKRGQYFRLKLCDCCSSSSSAGITSSVNADVDIGVTFFDKAVDRFYSMLEEGNVYSFSGGRLKHAAAMKNEQWKSPFEIIFDEKSLVNAMIVCKEEKKKEIFHVDLFEERSFLIGA